MMIFLIRKLKFQAVNSMFSYEYLVEENMDVAKANLVLYWLVVSVFIIAILFLVFVKNINDYFELVGIVVSDNQVSVMVPVENIEMIIDGKQLFIDKDSFNYNLDKIDGEIVYNQGIMMQKVTLNIPLRGKNIENNIVNLKIEKESKKFFNQILRYWRGKI